jgi:hypothetical protein
VVLTHHLFCGADSPKNIVSTHLSKWRNTYARQGRSWQAPTNMHDIGALALLIVRRKALATNRSLARPPVNPPATVSNCCKLQHRIGRSMTMTLILHLTRSSLSPRHDNTILCCVLSCPKGIPRGGLPGTGKHTLSKTALGG